MNEPDRHNPLLVARLRRVAAVILILGLLSALLVFIFVRDSQNDVSAYQIIDGVSYPVDVNNTKSYNYNMERIAGKSAVFASDFDDWFSGLWHGKELAYTLAVLSVVLSLLCYWAAHLSSLPPLDDESDKSDWHG